MTLNGDAMSGKFSLLPRLLLRPLHTVALTCLLLAVSIGAGVAEPHAALKARDHVYLLRGAFNIFSLGLDEIADKLQRYGVNTTVTNYLGWESLADEAAADYKAGRVHNIILVGHSSGATAVTEFAARLGQLGVPVKLAIGLDPTSREVASGNVGRYVNYYIAGGLGYAVVRAGSSTACCRTSTWRRIPSSAISISTRTMRCRSR